MATTRGPAGAEGGASPFAIGRSANIHDPATVARFEDHALYIQNQISMAKFREPHIARTPGNYWPNGP